MLHQMPLKIALITPKCVAQPSIGFTLRLHQTQTLLERVSSGRLCIWDLHQMGPAGARVGVDGESPAVHSTRNGPRQSTQPLRDVGAIALYAWPSFVVRSLGDERRRIFEWLEQVAPSVVVLEHPYATELLPDLRGKGLRVFVDAQNVESDVARQLIPLASSRGERLRALVRWLAIRRWEKRFFPLATEIWVPSEVDARRQDELCSARARVRCVPNTLDTARYPHEAAERTDDMVLPASFGYQPNVVGARLIRDRVLSMVKQSVPGTRLVLLGADPNGWARELGGQADVVVTGTVPDTRPYLRRAGVVVVPILQGGGTRYKILEALALGLPVVTTPLGREGIAVRDGEHLLIRQIDEFAPAITSVLSDPQMAANLGRKGRALVERDYSWQSAESILRAALA